MLSFCFIYQVKLNSTEQSLNSFRTPSYFNLTDIKITSDVSIYSPIFEYAVIYDCKKNIFQRRIFITNKIRFT
jgi:hypothetical protein